ncbi:MAG TPA: rod shape-determining protein MreD [Burkholderiaceae bacterium]|nr:rod shape-determining protein MreD [Burkholderiaceae bacterium]
MKFIDQLRTAFALRARAEPVELTTLAGSVRGYQPKVLLQPVNPWFIWLTLIGAFLMNLVPWGAVAWVPDFLALALVFWNVHQPRRVGIGAAFVFGLLMDVHDGALFGEHALAYTLLSYGAISLHRRILWFPLAAQSVHVLPLLVVAQVASLLIRLWVGGAFPGWSYFLESLVGGLLWPVITWVLLAPQRRPIDRDQTRPI